MSLLTVCEYESFKDVLTVYECENLKRVGNDYGDGGYVITDLKDGYDLFLSTGVGGDVSFEVDFCNMYGVNCTVFDAEDESAAAVCEPYSNITLIQKNIGGENSDKVTNLQEYIRAANNCFLKMDIEGREWTWLDALHEEDLLKIKQMVMEFHFPTSKKHWELLKKIVDTHYLIHYHVNNADDSCLSGTDISIPLVFECTFLRKDQLTSVKLNTKTFPTELDRRNKSEKRDIFTDKSPFSNTPQNVITVKIYYENFDAQHAFNNFKNLTNNGRWRNIQFVTHDNADYIVVLNSTNATLDPQKTIVLQMEPLMRMRANQWGGWANPDKKYLTAQSNGELQWESKCLTVLSDGLLHWQLSKTYSQLCTEVCVKDDRLTTTFSVIFSNKHYEDGHILRRSFVEYLYFHPQQQLDFHVFGGNYYEKYGNYKGSLAKKEDGLFPYKYTLNIESVSCAGYVTEKLIDGILSECLTFYHGCTNITDVLGIDPLAYVYLDLQDFSHDAEVIKKAISEDWWTQRIDIIRKEKCRILHKLQLMPKLHDIINSYNDKNKVEEHTITCNLQGGLGNQLFQIFSTMALAIKEKCAVTFPNHIDCGAHTSTYWNIFGDTINSFISDKKTNLKVWNEPGFSFHELPTKKSLCLNGYFQSWRYFEEQSHDIVKLLKLPSVIQVESGTILVGVHICQGKYSDIHPLLPSSYYINSINALKKQLPGIKLTFVFVYEDGEVVANEIITHFPNELFATPSKGMNDIGHFTVLTQCSHHIIANSTFSWWGAYLAGKLYPLENQCVFYPSVWFADEKDTRDLFPPTWTCVSAVTKTAEEPLTKSLSDSEAPLTKSIYYINLEHRKDRLAQIKDELSKINLPAKRIEGVYNAEVGILGCTKSHILALEQFLKGNDPYLIVFEDDVTFTSNPVPDITKFLATVKKWDVLMLAAGILSGRDDDNGYTKILSATTMAAYMVNRHFAPLLLNVLKQSEHLLTTQSYKATYCNDMMWCLLQPLCNWYALRPLLCKQRGGSFSDIEKRITNYGW